MDALSSIFPIKHLILYSTIVSFGVCSLAPAHYIHHDANVVNLAVVGIRVKKLTDKFEKYKESKNLEKLIDCMIEVKQEAESCLNKALSFSDIFDSIESEMKKKGQKLNKDQVSILKKAFKKKEGRKDHRVLFMADCIEMGIVYDSDLEELCFQAKHKEKEEGKEERNVEVPLEISIAIVCCLTGGFLYMIPVPMSKEVGAGLFAYGVQKLYDECRNDQNNEAIKK